MRIGRLKNPAFGGRKCTAASISVAGRNKPVAISGQRALTKPKPEVPAP